MTFARSSRISSMPRFDAPSISMTSMSSPVKIDRQASHSLHGSGVGASELRQLSALARIRAIVVLPTPRVPVNRNACAMRPDLIALTSVRAMGSCPTTSSKVRLRYLRARTR